MQESITDGAVYLLLHHVMCSEHLVVSLFVKLDLWVWMVSG